MPGEFHLDGISSQLMLGSPTAETLAALVGEQIVLKSNINPSQQLTQSGGVFYVPWRTVTVLANGHISEDGVNNGIMLLANDTTLGLSNPVQWTLHPGRVTLGGKQIKLASWTFQAPAPGASRTLDQLAPVPNIPAVSVATIGIDQVTGPSDYAKNFLANASDAAHARTLIGADRFQFLGNVTSQAAMLALTGERGDYCNRTDLGTGGSPSGATFVLQGSDPTQLSSWVEFDYPVTTVAGKSGAVTLVNGDVGLGNVDNTSDANKPVSTAQAAALLGLVQAAKNPDLLVTGAATVDGTDLLTSAAVVWPGGSPGTLTITSRDANSAVLAYNITYGSPVTKTFTQPAITRNANGAATNVPAIVVT